MKTVFHSHLINSEFGDPGVYVEIPWERRALLFDLGDLSNLSARQLLRITDVFVSHTHMDHFIGFDQLLRVLVGRQKTVRLFGPPGFIDQVGHRLAAYTWNLVDNFDQNLQFIVTEIAADGEQWRGVYRLDTAFSPGLVTRRSNSPAPWVLLQEPLLKVSTAMLDHHVPSLGFRLEEPIHLGVLKNQVEALGLQLGSWIHTARKALMAGAPAQTVIRAAWRRDGVEVERFLPLGQLRPVFKQSPGQVLCYVVDCAFNHWNNQRILALAQHADPLYIETSYLHELAAEAAKRKHLTAHQAGTLARLAQAKRVIPFHFSTRHENEANRLRDELDKAFRKPRA